MATRKAALKEWIKQGSPNLEPLLTGCAWQPLLPDAYHASCRNADRLSRPYSLKASVAFLQTMLGLMPADIRAVVGPCYDRRMEEYRVGLGPKDKDETYHGIVWPLLGAEDEATTPPAKLKPCCAKPGSRTWSSSTTTSRWNSATTAAPRSTPTPKPNWCTPKCRNRPPPTRKRLH